MRVNVIFQDICRQKCEWDEQLGEGVKMGVVDWSKDLIDCRKIDVKRCIYDHPREEEEEECSLHGFADASKKAYCGVVYLVYRTQVGRYAQILTSKKRRVAPLKDWSIPRLELMAALTLVKRKSMLKVLLPSSRVLSLRNCGWLVRLPCSGL